MVGIHDQQLTDLTLEDLQKQAKDLDLRADDGTKSLLNWVWDTIKGPCLHALGSEDPPEAGSLPHVEWTHTGLVSRSFECRKFARTTTFDNVVYRVTTAYTF
ncbi:hypothetical protein BFJ66_g9069 [Fusarium oxysporum f. sp. cepae]|uniref:Uncharacterized protein n=1 Tax=Fusarium oxysporum f. sp. cepae TaxID=396571 RepID=A0A3L6NZD0_FUSOX|nr:hypothetical protein BFJ65_g3144 [Fusarium oxysporum f. sp. cepae]RKK45501.1 hypothetical protein BFJ66_g9069 [Fusarium oxysporum f. sp. cepae]RKK53716.1 hypothetical protein BFJ67_g5052 [Fusarium oxysporum f. sp. cepae]